MSYYVYIHTNLINNKKYIGITCLKPIKRWQNGKGYSKQSLFNNAIQKYGWDNFKHEILFCNLTKEQAEMFEIELIKYYKSNDRNFGYNQSAGGESGAKGVKQNRKFYINRNKAMQIPIICLDNKEKFASIKEASEKLNLNHRHISRVLAKQRKSTGGLHFEYLDKYDENKQYDLKLGITKPKSIICLNTGKIFSSITQAGIEYNLDISAIAKVCKGKRKYVKGFYF